MPYLLVDTWIVSLDLNNTATFGPYARGVVRRGEARGVVEEVAEEVGHEVIPPPRCLMVRRLIYQHGKPSAQRLVLHGLLLSS